MRTHRTRLMRQLASEGMELAQLLDHYEELEREHEELLRFAYDKPPLSKPISPETDDLASKTPLTTEIRNLHWQMAIDLSRRQEHKALAYHDLVAKCAEAMGFIRFLAIAWELAPFTEGAGFSVRLTDKLFDTLRRKRDPSAEPLFKSTVSIHCPPELSPAIFDALMVDTAAKLEYTFRDPDVPDLQVRWMNIRDEQENPDCLIGRFRLCYTPPKEP